MTDDPAAATNALPHAARVEGIGVYKPHPAAYQSAVDRLKPPAERISFQSPNGRDDYGAWTFGTRPASRRGSALPDGANRRQPGWNRIGRE